MGYQIALPDKHRRPLFSPPAISMIIRHEGPYDSTNGIDGICGPIYG